MSTKIVQENPIINDVLSVHSQALGKDLPAYRGHVYRMFNNGRWLADRSGVLSAESEAKLAIAAAFHDLGIWAAETFDYLEPSIALAAAHLQEIGKEAWLPEVTKMIDNHHKVRSTSRDPRDLVEIFRRADRADLSKGLLRSGLPKDFIGELNQAFPNAGFHRKLLAFARAWWPSHLLDPLPMFKW